MGNEMYKDTSHNGSVNAVAWAPHEFGLEIAAASADGKISLLTYQDGESKWYRQEYPAHVGGVNSISWCSPHSDNSAGGAWRFATGGCDNTVKIWSKKDK